MSSPRSVNRSGRLPCTAAFCLILAWNGSSAEPPAVLETPALRLSLRPESGRYELVDKRSGVVWESNPQVQRFGEITVWGNGRQTRLPLGPCTINKTGLTMEATFKPLADQPEATVTVCFAATADNILEIAYRHHPGLSVESVRLLDDALWTSDTMAGQVLVPAREGLLIPADSGKEFTHRFGTFDYEGCHMEMFGVLRGGSAAMVTWRDPYVVLELRSVVTNAPWLRGRQALLSSLTLRKSARSCRVHLLGPGDHVTVAQAYREVARQKGWLVTWDTKLDGHPERAAYFGASNYKLWSMLTRRMNEDSTREESVRVNWTFPQAARVAEHLKNDLQLDRVLFILGGWIHRGYDNQHPDILPTAPECGGDEAFIAACRRIRELGYLLSLHDNYQDIYRDSPSWDESLVNKNAEGKLTTGGHWAGGRAYITCAQKALELARRPNNLTAVKRLSGATSYFIDTTYAAGLYECFDPNHPMTKADDMKWKQALSDYAREVFGSFGSECGREWAIPHSDFFEGLTGVSGGLYHNKDLLRQLGASGVPLFELVYHDTIAAYGKYGYDMTKAADYVLHHLLLGRPLHYHNIPSGLYWQGPTREERSLPLRPGIAELKSAGSGRFTITYRWNVTGELLGSWPVFVHFTDAAGKILFQGDHTPTPPMNTWKPGEVLHGPLTVQPPPGLNGTFDIRVGLFDQADSGRRLRLQGQDDGERRYLLGRVKIQGEAIVFFPAEVPAGDPALFCKADGGWAEGMHPLDRFVKNTHEILSPLNFLTARVPMTSHKFLTSDRFVEQTVFGDGARPVMVVVVNRGAAPWRHRSLLGGDVELPPLGFVVEGPEFVAFHASCWSGLRYQDAPLFTLRSLDGQPLERSREVRVFHGFGDPRLVWRGRTLVVARETMARGD